ncbi:MAG TPA: hypothetical protein VG265_10400 [Gaiellaceae bacterium]|jgi:hypothetical protein|nr:hypothetical protein [Gaiellaceae bacterium]
MRRAPPGTLSVVAMFLVALVFAGTGGYYVLVDEHGTRARATVTGCRDHVVYTSNGSRTVTNCTGYWILGGRLGAGGRKVFGEVRGAGWSDLEETVGVRVYRGRAYTYGSALAIGLFAAAGLFVLVGVGLIFVLRRLARPRAVSAA